jgi:bifunctional DNase/RNase
MTFAGMLALPVAIAVGSMALFVSAAQPGGRDEALVELEVAGVFPLPEGPAGLLVLRDKASGTLLPLLVPDGNALGAEAPSRRAPEGLLGRTIEALGAKVREVEIDEAEETSAGSRVRLAQGNRQLEIPARPSESIALALAAGVPILATRRLLAESGLTPEELAETRAELEAGPSTKL